MKNVKSYIYILSAVLVWKPAYATRSDSSKDSPRPTRAHAAGAAGAAAEPLPRIDYEAIPAQLTEYAFHPNDFQRLGGEQKYEKEILCLLQKLRESFARFEREATSELETDPEAASASERALKDVRFLQIRDQLAERFLRLYSYANQLPKTVPESADVKIRHANSAKEVVESPLFSGVLAVLERQRPALMAVVPYPANQELTRHDFKQDIYIGKNPFFEPVCDLLSHLYQEDGTKDIGCILNASDEKLRKRYIYSSYIKPLGQVADKVREIIPCYCVSGFMQRNPLGMTQQGVACMATIFKYEDDKRFLEHLSLLGKIISQDIGYRYDVSPKPEPLTIDVWRASVPWSALLQLGSAAHYAQFANTLTGYLPEVRRRFYGLSPLSEKPMEDIEPYQIREVLRCAADNLITDFQELQKHLIHLQDVEHTHFLDSGALVQTRRYEYPHIKRFSEWYLCFSGFSMTCKQINALKAFLSALDGGSHAQPWEAKRQFLQKKSRLLVLSYFCNEGELANHFRNILDGDLKEFNEVLNKLRNKIAHVTQSKGQKAFEGRLTEIDDAKWNQIVGRYYAIYDIMKGLQKNISPRDPEHQRERGDLLQQETIPLFDWETKKEMSELLPTLSRMETIQIREFKEELEFLIEILTFDVLKTAYEERRKTFCALLPPEKRLQFWNAKLLEYTDKNWNLAFTGFPKKIHDTRQAEEWKALRNAAEAWKAQNASQENTSEALVRNLKNLEWIISQLMMTYDVGDGRERRTSTGGQPLLEMPEARIGDLYLILLRESAKYIKALILEDLEFVDQTPEKLVLRHARLNLEARLSRLVFEMSNKKAHLHSLTEASLFQMEPELMHVALMPILTSTKEYIKIILGGPEEQRKTFIRLYIEPMYRLLEDS